MLEEVEGIGVQYFQSIFNNQKINDNPNKLYKSNGDSRLFEILAIFKEMALTYESNKKPN